MAKAQTSRRQRVTTIGEPSAKAALYDELVDRLAAAEDELEQTRRELRDLRRSLTRDGIDPVWRSIANDLCGALQPYRMFREQRVIDGRIVVETRVPGSTLSKASDAIRRYARQVAIESYRESGMRAPDDDALASVEREAA